MGLTWSFSISYDLISIACFIGHGNSVTNFPKIVLYPTYSIGNRDFDFVAEIFMRIVYQYFNV
jgi:hypothetical protein